MTSTVAWLEVGEGDCTLLVDGGAAVIIDCPNGKEAAALDEAERLGATEVAAIVASHTHRDHLVGLPSVVGRALLRGLLAPAAPFHVNNDRLRGTPELRRVLKDLVNHHLDGSVELRTAERGQFGVLGATSWTMVAPEHAGVIAAAAYGDPNLASAIVLVTVDGWDGAVLVGGDATLETWLAAHASDPLPQHAIVRWPHHGGHIGAADSHETLYGLLDPAAVVVSVGHQDLHPNDDFRAAAADHASETLCTGAGRGCPSGTPACRGTVRLVVEDGGYEIQADHDCPGPGCC